MANILAIYNGAHPVHTTYGNAIGADPYNIEEKVAKRQFAPIKALRLLKNSMSLPTNYDIVLTESCYYYPALRRRLGGLKSKIVNMSVGPLFYHIVSGRIGGMEKKMLLSLAKEIDGHIVLGKFGQETVRKIDKSTPLEIAYPFISEENYSKLSGLEPELDSKRMAIIATHDYWYKGLDIAIEAAKIAHKQDKEIRLDVIGNIPEKEINRLSCGHPAIKNMGFVPDLGEALSKCSLYVHPSRGDVFPVSVLEAMVAGLPSIVSEDTGTKEAAGVLGNEFVGLVDPEDIAKRMLGYFERDDKGALSARARKESSKYRESIQVPYFKKKFERLSDRL